jgi:hypothetical protein
MSELGSNREELTASKCLPGYPLKADLARCSRHISKVPMIFAVIDDPGYRMSLSEKGSRGT